MDTKTYRSTASHQANKAPQYRVAWTCPVTQTRSHCDYATRAAAKALVEKMWKFERPAIWGKL